MSEIDLSQYDITPEFARELLWGRGNLTFKLDDNQLQLRDAYLNAKTTTVVWSCARRLGKSYTLCVIAIEKCLTQKNAKVKYLAPTQKMVRTIIRPLMRQLTADAPDHIRPKENKAEGIWYFPTTGSQIQIVGCDGGNAESARGSDSDLCMIDEAGFVEDLNYIVGSVLNPTMLLTDGKTILASTPPKSPTHEFVLFMNQAKEDGSFIQKTIYDNPRITPEKIRKVAEEDCGGIDTIAFKREYLAQVVVDDDSAIIPEFNKEIKAQIVQEWKRPGFYTAYTAMDLGMSDLTVILFAYYDFKAQKLVVEDEFVVNGKECTTENIAKNIVIKEKSNFTDPFTGEVAKSHRYSDNNLQVINDLQRTYGIPFVATEKREAEIALNNVRVLIAAKKIIINPRCRVLISHLEAGVWNKQKTSFARSGTKFGHFDAIDSLKYLVRNVDFNRNPFPAGYGLASGPNAFYPKGKPKSDSEAAFMKILNLKTKN